MDQNESQFEGTMVADSGMVALLNKSDIDQQIATAHKYPRSIKQFRDQSLQLVTLTEAIAQECIYALPRDGKTIEGPTARFAEIIASSWHNCRAGARVVSDTGDFVTAQGVFHDLENNVAITYEVQRRVVDKQGRRYKPDMIGVTGNAASSIALRNAILKGVPKALWNDLYQAARKCVMGDFKTLANRRAGAIEQFQAYGVSKEMICATLGVAGVEDIGLEKLVVLAGLLTAIKDGDTTVEQAFGGDKGSTVQQPVAKGATVAAATAPTATTAEPAASSSATTEKPKDPGIGEDGVIKPLSNGHHALLAAKMTVATLSAADFKNKFGCDFAPGIAITKAQIEAWIADPSK